MSRFVPAVFSLRVKNSVSFLSFGWWFAVSCGLLLPVGSLWAQTSSFGQIADGSSSSATPVTVTVTRAGTVSAVEVLTEGTSGLDYASSGTSCAGSLTVNAQCSVTVTFTPQYPGLRTGAVVLVDSSNNVLGMTYLFGTGVGSLAVLVPGNYIPVAGNGAWDLPGDGQGATSGGELNQPSSVVLDGAGNMYIADSAHNRIRKVTQSTGLISTVAGNGTAAYTGDGGLAGSATLNTPSGLAIDGAGVLYIADTGNNAIRMVLPGAGGIGTGTISTIAGTGVVGSGGDSGSATAAQLNQPWGVTIVPNGDLYIADTSNHRIRLVTRSTGIITTVAGTGFTNADGSGAYSGDGGPATSAELNRPFAVAFDELSNMYIPDSLNNRVRMVNTSGVISTFAGTGVASYGGDGGLATSAELWAPSGVIVDVGQNVYISDTQNNAIRKVNARAGTISTILKSGVGYDYWENNLYVQALYGPIGLSLDGEGNLYIADFLYMRIREIQSNVSLLMFTNTPVRQGDTSTAQAQMLENDGNAPLDLTGFTADSNAKVDTTTTTCGTGTPYLAADESCNVGVEFAPSSAGDPLFGNVDVSAQSVNAVSPPYLDIMLAGDATAVNSTTTVLTSNRNPSSFGQNVTFTATVTTGANTGALTGTVAFVDTSTGTTLQAAASVNSSGIATFTTPALAVGLHNITATYSGDSLHFASSTTAALAEVVNEATATTVVTNANPALLGATVTFTATVSISGGGGVTPVGTVSFYDGVTALGTATLNGSGVAQMSTSSLIAGSHSITASYSGDPTYYMLASTSTALNQDIQAATTATLASTLNPSTYGAAVTFTSVITSGSGAPTSGNVDFYDGATHLGTASLAGNTGVATFTTSTLNAGSHTITAHYEGSLYDAPVTSSTVIEVVNLAQTSTTATSTPVPGIAGKAVQLAATVIEPNGTGQITGTVTFREGSTVLGTGTIANGVATTSYILSPGAHTVIATYSGDHNNNGSVSAALSVNVVLATTQTGIATSSSPSIVLSSVTFTATVSGNGGLPTGAVTFSADGATVGTGTLNSSGQATFSTAALGVGNHTISATYSGDTDDLPSSSTPLTQAVVSIPTATALGTTATTGQNPQTILVASVVGTSGPIPTGTVTFTTGSTLIGSASVDSTGVATLSPDLSTGNYQVVAKYSGDAIHGSSTSMALGVSTIADGFNIVATPATLSLATTQNGSLNIALSSNNKFADTVALGCSALPFAVNCHFSTDTVTLTSGQAQTVQLTIDTNNPLGGGATAKNIRGSGESLARIFWPAGLIFGLAFWRFRKRHAIVFTTVLALLLSGAMFATGCGGYSQSSATPGTYTIQVNGVGANSNISHYATVTLTITK